MKNRTFWSATLVTQLAGRSGGHKSYATAAVAGAAAVLKDKMLLFLESRPRGGG